MDLEALRAELSAIKAMLDSIAEQIGLGAETESRFLTVIETASIMGVSPRTVYRWVESGRLPARRLSSRVLRISTHDLDRALRSGLATDARFQ